MARLRPSTAGLVLASLLAWGCASGPQGTYSHPAKDPVVLDLAADGRYSLTPTFRPEPAAETGRWWALDRSIVVLVPDDPGTAERYAVVGETPWPRGYTLHATLRAALAAARSGAGGPDEGPPVGSR